MSKIRLDFYYDIVSVYSYAALELLNRHFAAGWSQKITLNIRPVSIAFIMRLTGNTPPMSLPARAAYSLKDTLRMAKYYGLNIDPPPNILDLVQKGTFGPMRFVAAVDVLSDGRKTEAITFELFKRIYASHQDVHETSSLREAALKCGMSEFEVDEALASVNSPKVRDRLKSNTEEAVAHGAFGVPTMVAHLPSGPEMFFGHDRIELLAHTLGVPYIGPLTSKM